MSHYRSNLRDVEFNLFELFDRGSVYGRGAFEEFDVDSAKEILAEVDRIARERLAPSFESADRTPPVYDPATKSVTMPEEFAKSFHAWIDAGYWSLAVPEEIGGQPAPASLVWSTAKFVLGSNPAIWIYGTGPASAAVIYRNGTDRDKKIAALMIEKQWTATMVLTEADAGSDVGAGRTKAFPNEDGTWNIEGVKRFITSAEHDMSENIMHMVLARPTGVDGAGGPGTKGLSLFLVPKYHFDPETGELTGERNGVYATNLERKMGFKVSTTCELTLGDPQLGGPARGWLLGDVHDGINQMFRVIESARMTVGTKAISTLSSGYLHALDYAKQRVQGPDLTRAADKTAPRVAIIRHPDVRRALFTLKSFAEGLRSLAVLTATYQDAAMQKRADGEDPSLEESVNDLLLPLVKGYGSERAWVLLGTEALQTLGGSGFLQDYPLEQYIRDAKIDTLYEGTTAIQGMDLFFRKIVKNKGVALTHLAGEIGTFAADPDGPLATERALLARALEDSQAIVGVLFAQLMAADPSQADGDVTNIYKVGLNTTRLVFALGDVVLGWLLLRGAQVAHRRLEAGATGSERDFYEGKIAAASFYATNILPRLAAERAIAENTDGAIMSVPDAAL